MMPDCMPVSGIFMIREFLSDLKALIPDIRRTREQLQLKRMLQNNNEVLMAMFSQEMSFLLDAKNAMKN